MNTAAVLLENLIQGIQTLCWMLLLALTFIDHGELAVLLSQQNATATTILAVAICYWLGIIVDTAYYHAFIQRHESKWADKLIPPGSPSLSHMVFKCIIKSSDLSKLFQERQAHLRMLRVSMVNIVFLTPSALLFLNFQGKHRPSVATSLTVSLLGIFSFAVTAYAWKKLYKYYVTMVQTSYSMLSLERAESVARSSLPGVEFPNAECTPSANYALQEDTAKARRP